MDIIFKPLTGAQVTLSCEPDTTIALTKIKLYDIYGIDPACEFFKTSIGKLDNFSDFAQYNICSKETLTLYLPFGMHNRKLPLRGHNEHPLTEQQLDRFYCQFVNTL